MIDIQQRLKTIFQTQRLVFWYDDNEALKNEFNEIDLDDVTKLEIDNNEFGIRHSFNHLFPYIGNVVQSFERIQSCNENSFIFFFATQ